MMNRHIVCFAFFLVCAGFGSNTVVGAQTPEEILLKDYKPRSIFNIPETRIEMARYSVIDVHSHDYVRTGEVERWVQTMDKVGVQKTIILSGATGSRFDMVLTKYRSHPAGAESITPGSINRVSAL